MYNLNSFFFLMWGQLKIKRFGHVTLIWEMKTYEHFDTVLMILLQLSFTLPYHFKFLFRNLLKLFHSFTVK